MYRQKMLDLCRVRKNYVKWYAFTVGLEYVKGSRLVLDPLTHVPYSSNIVCFYGKYTNDNIYWVSKNMLSKIKCRLWMHLYRMFQQFTLWIQNSICFLHFKMLFAFLCKCNFFFIFSMTDGTMVLISIGRYCNCNPLPL